MRFGVGYWSLAATRLRPRHHVLLYDELCRDAVLAEAFGFADYWLVEHHFWYDGHINAELTALGAVATVTSRIGIGTSCLLLPLHDPLRVAEMAATVDRLSKGRLRLVFGLGYRDEEFDGFGVSRLRRAKRMEEGLEFLNRVWTAEQPFEFRGKQFNYGRVECRPRPIQRPPLLYLGGFVPQTARRAARYGCGLQLGPVITAERGSALVAAYHEAGREAGVDTSEKEIGICRDFWVAPTVEEARRTARPRLFHYYGETVGVGWKLFRDDEGKLISTDRPELLAAYARASVDSAIVGDPKHVSEEIERLRRGGFNYVQLRLRFDSLPFEAVRDSMQLFATEVMPRFREKDHIRDGAASLGQRA